nr:glycosyltransferase [Brasilonema bromeliae]
MPDLGHYHHARIQAYAERGEADVTVVVVGGKGLFAEFAHRGDRPPAYRTVTLFPDRFFADLPAADLGRAVENALAAERCSVVLAQGWAAAYSLAALRWAVARDVPRVVTSESQRDDFARSPVKEWVKRRLVGLCGAALCGGTRHAEYARDLGVPADRIFLGYDAVDNAHYAAGADAARTNPGARTRLGLPPAYLLASARFIPKKNLPGLLAGYAAYRAAVGPGAWELVVLGDGAGRPELEARRGELGLAGVVHLPGFRGYDALPAYYGLAEGFVHASLVEQWGLVINEAAAAGVPVVASDRCGATADLVQPGRTGWAFAPTDSAALGAALVELHRHPDRRSLGQAGRQLVAEWGPERFAAGLSAAVAAATPARRPGLVGRAVLRAVAARPPVTGGE